MDDKTTVTWVPALFPCVTTIYNDLGSFTCDECGGKGIVHGHKFCPWCGRTIVEKAQQMDWITNR